MQKLNHPYKRNVPGFRNFFFSFSGCHSSLLCHNLRQERRPASSDQPPVDQRRVVQRGRLRKVLRRRVGGRGRIPPRAWRHSQRSQARKYSAERQASYSSELQNTCHLVRITFQPWESHCVKGSIISIAWNYAENCFEALLWILTCKDYLLGFVFSNII